MKKITDWVRMSDTHPPENKTIITAVVESYNGERMGGRCQNVTNTLLGYYIDPNTNEIDLTKPAFQTDQYNNEETGYKIEVLAWMDDVDEYDEDEDYVPLKDRGLESDSFTVWNTNPEYYIQKKREVDDADSEDYRETRAEDIAKKGWTKWDYRDDHPGQKVPREIIEKV